MFVKALEPDADAFCERAKDQDLLIVSATGFGCPGYARVSYCVDYDMIERSFWHLKNCIRVIVRGNYVRQ